MIRHIVTWTLIGEDAATKAEQASFVTAQLMSLPPLIPEITSLTVTSNVVSIDGNWDLVLIGDYVDEGALKAYIEHPEHQKVVAQIKPFFASRAAIDIEV